MMRRLSTVRRALGFLACCMAAGCGGETVRDENAVAATSDKRGESMKKSVIILCTGNSCRSQMAEAFWKKYGGNEWEVVSAGTKPKGEIYPPAIVAMREIGIDMSGQRPKGPEGFTNREFDLVVTVCDNAERECPAFARSKTRLHWPFDDPPKAAGTSEDKMQVCRRVRDEIQAKVKQYLENSKS